MCAHDDEKCHLASNEMEILLLNLCMFVEFFALSRPCDVGMVAPLSLQLG